MSALRSFDTITASESGATLELHDPEGNSFVDDDGNPITITVKGSDSKLYTQAQHDSVSKRINKRMGKGSMKLKSDEWEQDALDLLIKCTVGWSGIVLDSKALEFSEANVRLVYTQFPWIREQVDEFVQDRGNFLGNLSKSSSPTRKASST